jgi:hypothetical protein
MTDTKTGHCLCGSVEYSFSGDPAMVASCHCDDCQRQSGACFSLNVAVPLAALTVDDAKLKTFATTGTDSGQPRERRFCPECGSPVITLLAEMPDLAFIKAGTLDDRSWLQPQVEVWRESAQSWIPENDAVGSFPRDLQQA